MRGLTMLAHVFMIYVLLGQAIILFKLLVSPPRGWALARPILPAIVWLVILHWAILIWPTIMVARGIALVRR